MPDSWLKDFLKTSAGPEKIAECLSLSGPSVEKVEKHEGENIYHIEVSTNRVDSAGVYGIAREAAAILPGFGIKAELLPLEVKAGGKLVKKVSYLEAKVDHNLCYRFAAVLVKNVSVGESPEKIQKRLRAVGVRPINNVVDISNYLMHELGQPVHTFDYDKIKGAKMVLRASRKGEKLTTLDGKIHELPGADIIIEDGDSRLIDLAGIMGGENSEVSEKTKNILLFVQTYNPVNIRKTSVALAQRTEAVSLFEKGLDTELVEVTLRRGIDLFHELTGGEAEEEILDLYPSVPKERTVTVELEFLERILGVELKKKEVEDFFNPLGFTVDWKGKTLFLTVPSWRTEDVQLPEDVVEEVARIYGYHNLPSELPGGKIPEPPLNSPFEFERKIKQTLSALGGTEVYTSSLVSKEKAALAGVPSWVLRLRNPLGKDTEYLRLSLAPSLVHAAGENAGEKEPFHLFEMANVYLPVRGDLPEEKMTLGGIFSGYDFRGAKGIVENLLAQLKVEAKFVQENARGYLANHRASVKAGNKEVGEIGFLKGGLIYYQFATESLLSHVKLPTFNPIPKYPAQIEDISLVLAPRTLIGELIDTIRNADKQVVLVELIDTYNDSITLRIKYQDPNKTLTDKEVERIREKILKRVREKHKAKLKA